MFSDLKCLPLTAGDNEMQSLLKEKQDLEFLRWVIKFLQPDLRKLLNYFRKLFNYLRKLFNYLALLCEATSAEKEIGAGLGPTMQ